MDNRAYYKLTRGISITLAALLLLAVAALTTNGSISVSMAITFIFGVIMVTWTFVGGMKQSSMYRRLNQELQKLTSDLKEPGFKHIDTPEDLRKVDEIFAAYSHQVKRCWHEFYEALTVRKLQDRIVVRNTEQASSFFSLEKLDSSFNDQNLVSIGGTMMTLGILGTFTGLTVGLLGFEIGNTAETRTSISHLLGGMQTSFITSVIGIVLGIGYNYVFRTNRAKTAEYFELFRSELDFLFRRQTSEEILDHVLLSSQEQAATLATLSEDLALQLGRMFEQALTPALNRVSESVGTMSQNIIEQQTTATDSMANAFIGKLTGTLEERFKHLASHLDKSVENTERLGASLERSQSSLVALFESYEAISGRLETLLEKMATILNESQKHVENTLLMTSK